jgi:hypothetical protein
MYRLDMDALRPCPSVKKPLQLLGIDRLAHAALVLNTEQSDLLALVAESHSPLAPMYPHGTEFL